MAHLYDWGGTVDSPRERDEFERIKLHQDIEKARQIVALYEDNQADYRNRIEEYMRDLGRLDERLGES
jgi:hypothetical protein